MSRRANFPKGLQLNRYKLPRNIFLLNFCHFQCFPLYTLMSMVLSTATPVSIQTWVLSLFRKVHTGLPRQMNTTS
ncbi:Uncharacterised protein [Halioglobus japonicus]|nr:Uncharacterised protein [Halioglobus japonicus]